MPTVFPSAEEQQDLNVEDFEKLNGKEMGPDGVHNKSVLVYHASASKIHPPFEDSSTCCSTTCMEDSMSSLKVSSHHQFLDMLSLERSHDSLQQRQFQEYDDRGHIAAYGDRNDGSQNDEDQMQKEKHLRSLEESLSRSLASLVLPLSHGEDAHNHFDEREIDNNYQEGSQSSLNSSTSTTVRLYRRRRGRYRPTRNSLQATSMDIRSLPRELEMADQERIQHQL